MEVTFKVAGNIVILLYFRKISGWSIKVPQLGSAVVYVKLHHSVFENISQLMLQNNILTKGNFFFLIWHMAVINVNKREY